MKIKLLRTPPASMRCDLVEGQTTTVDEELGDRLLTMGIATVIVSKQGAGDAAAGKDADKEPLKKKAAVTSRKTPEQLKAVPPAATITSPPQTNAIEGSDAAAADPTKSDPVKAYTELGIGDAVAKLLLPHWPTPDKLRAFIADKGDISKKIKGIGDATEAEIVAALKADAK